MKDFWYDKIECPLCSHIYEYAKVAVESIKISKYDKDLKPYFKGPNNIKYSLISCPECKFTFSENDKDMISNRFLNRPEIKKNINNFLSDLKLVNKINNTSDKNDEFYKEQIIISAEIYALLDKPFDVAKLFLKLAWLYRDKKENENELKALKNVLYICENSFSKAEKDSETIFSLFYSGYINFIFNNKKQAARHLDNLRKLYGKNTSNPYVKAAKDIRSDLR